MNLSSRERRLLVVLGGVLVVMALVFILGRLGGGGEVADVVLPVPTESAPAPVDRPADTPNFVIPAGARDPFKP